MLKHLAGVLMLALAAPALAEPPNIVIEFTTGHYGHGSDNWYFPSRYYGAAPAPTGDAVS
jgi:hypothetical protein